MPDRVRFKEFAQVRSRNRTVSWQAGSEHDYDPIMDQPLADRRAVRVVEPELEPAPPSAEQKRVVAGSEVVAASESAARHAANAKMRAKPQG